MAKFQPLKKRSKRLRAVIKRVAQVIVPPAVDVDAFVAQEADRLAKEYGLQSEEIAVIAYVTVSPESNPLITDASPLPEPIRPAPIAKPPERKPKNPDDAYGMPVYDDNGRLLGFRQANGAVTLGRPLIAKERRTAENKGFGRKLIYRPLGLA
jgi:hypothetical protein